MFPEDEEWLAKVKHGEMLELDIKRPRNGALHRKWWALANYLSEHHSQLPTAEHASKYLLIRLGYCTVAKDIPIADSISFAKMDDDTFNALYSKACDLLCEIIQHVTDENVQQVLAEFAGVGALMETG